MAQMCVSGIQRNKRVKRLSKNYINHQLVSFTNFGNVFVFYFFVSVINDFSVALTKNDRKNLKDYFNSWFKKKYSPQWWQGHVGVASFV